MDFEQAKRDRQQRLAQLRAERAALRSAQDPTSRFVSTSASMWLGLSGLALALLVLAALLLVIAVVVVLVS